jgi:hypothetical protein
MRPRDAEPAPLMGADGRYVALVEEYPAAVGRKTAGD